MVGRPPSHSAVLSSVSALDGASAGLADQELCRVALASAAGAQIKCERSELPTLARLLQLRSTRPAPSDETAASPLQTSIERGKHLIDWDGSDLTFVEFGRTASHLLIPSSENVGFARLDARQEQSRETGALDRRPSQKLLCEDFGVPVNHSFSAVGPSVIYPQFGTSRHRSAQRSQRLTLRELGGRRQRQNVCFCCKRSHKIRLRGR